MRSHGKPTEKQARKHLWIQVFLQVATGLSKSHQFEEVALQFIVQIAFDSCQRSVPRVKATLLQQFDRCSEATASLRLRSLKEGFCVGFISLISRGSDILDSLSILELHAAA